MGRYFVMRKRFYVDVPIRDSIERVDWIVLCDLAFVNFPTVEFFLDDGANVVSSCCFGSSHSFVLGL